MIEKLKQNYCKFVNTLKPMTFRQRVDHIWTYYKEHIVLLLAVLILIVGTVMSICNAQTEVILSGTVVNLDLTQEGVTYLREGLYDHLGGTNRQEVQLSAVYFEELLSSVEKFDYNYNSAMGIVAMVSGKSLDYMFLDEVAMKFYLSQDIFMDLREFFTEEELAQMKDRLVYLVLEDGSQYPVAIHMENTPFAKDCIDKKDTVFFAWIANTPHMDACRVFWDYLNAWE